MMLDSLNAERSSNLDFRGGWSIWRRRHWAAAKRAHYPKSNDQLQL
jgi:hypothetical protein